MVQIPRSQGVQVGKNTQVSETAPTIAQSQIIPNAIRGLGQDLQQFGLQAEQKKAREQDSYNATQTLDFRNNLRRFDNKKKIELNELPANSETINTFKSKSSQDRQEFIESISSQYGDDKNLRRLLDKEKSTSFVNFEYNIDSQLSSKRKEFGINKTYESIGFLREQFEEAETDPEFAQIISDLNTTLKVGQASGFIDGKDIDRQIKAFSELRKEKQIEIEKEAAFSGVLSGEILLDNTNKNDADLINDNYNELIQKIEDPKEALELAETLSMRTSIVPDQAKRRWSATLFNGNNQQKIESAITINDLVTKNPKLNNQFSSREIALATEISNRVDLGIDEENIIKYAEEEIKQNKSQDRLIRQGIFNQEFKSFGSKDGIKTIKKIIDRFEDASAVFFEAEAPEDLASDFLSLTKDYYLNEGVSMDTAQKMATSKIESEWKITNIGKKRYQKYAPETFYGQGKWIQNQVISTIRKTTIDPLDNIDNEIRLQVVPQTLSSDKPAFYVLRESETGIIDSVLDSRNMPLIFTPDITKTKEYKKDVERRSKLGLTPKKEKEFLEKRKQGFNFKKIKEEDPFLQQSPYFYGSSL